MDQVGSHSQKEAKLLLNIAVSQSGGNLLLTTDNQRREFNAHQKAGLITILLKGGSALTTEDIARITGTSWQGAEFMMEMLSGVLPIVKYDGKWQWMSVDDGV